MNRDQAKKLISVVFNEAADDIDTDRLEVMRREVEAHTRTAHTKGLYEKMADALDTEIQARKACEIERGPVEQIRPQSHPRP